MCPCSPPNASPWLVDYNRQLISCSPCERAARIGQNGVLAQLASAFWRIPALETVESTDRFTRSTLLKRKKTVLFKLKNSADRCHLQSAWCQIGPTRLIRSALATSHDRRKIILAQQHEVEWKTDLFWNTHILSKISHPNSWPDRTDCRLDSVEPSKGKRHQLPQTDLLVNWPGNLGQDTLKQDTGHSKALAISKTFRIHWVVKWLQVVSGKPNCHQKEKPALPFSPLLFNTLKTRLFGQIWAHLWTKTKLSLSKNVGKSNSYTHLPLK